MLLKGLLKRPLKGLVESVFNDGIWAGDSASWDLIPLLDHTKADETVELLVQRLADETSLKGMRSNEQLCFPQKKSLVAQVSKRLS